MPSAESTPARVHEPEPVRPTRNDEVAAAGSELIGGPLGRRTLTGTSWLSPVRVVALVAIGMFALGLIQKAPCYNGGWFFGAVSQYTCLLLGHPAPVPGARIRRRTRAVLRQAPR